jgi:hypothetical protein
MRLFSLALITVLASALTACGDRPLPIEPIAASPPRVSEAQGRPTEVDISFEGPAFCTFDIHFHLTGKGKLIQLAGGRSIATSPGAVATLTNLDNQNQETFGITGAFHIDTLPDGKLVTVSTGRALLFDPFAGLVLAIGRFTSVFDPSVPSIQPLQGKGRLIDLCALLS